MPDGWRLPIAKSFSRAGVAAWICIPLLVSSCPCCLLPLSGLLPGSTNVPRVFSCYRFAPRLLRSTSVAHEPAQLHLHRTNAPPRHLCHCPTPTPSGAVTAAFVIHEADLPTLPMGPSFGTTQTPSAPPIEGGKPPCLKSRDHPSETQGNPLGRPAGGGNSGAFPPPLIGQGRGRSLASSKGCALARDGEELEGSPKA
jgi:hypothetical protein